MYCPKCHSGQKEYNAIAIASNYTEKQFITLYDTGTTVLCSVPRLLQYILVSNFLCFGSYVSYFRITVEMNVFQIIRHSVLSV